MLKFKGVWEKSKYPKRKHKLYGDARDVYHDWNIPTVDEVDEVMSPMYADTVLQILRGQGIYWGYECHTHADNEIRDIKTDIESVDTRPHEIKASWFREQYYELIKEERKAVRLIARFNNVPLHKAMDMYLSANEMLERKSG
jgi:hypothetical protein